MPQIIAITDDPLLSTDSTEGSPFTNPIFRDMDPITSQIIAIKRIFKNLFSEISIILELAKGSIHTKVNATQNLRLRFDQYQLKDLLKSTKRNNPTPQSIEVITAHLAPLTKFIFFSIKIFLKSLETKMMPTKVMHIPSTFNANISSCRKIKLNIEVSIDLEAVMGVTTDTAPALKPFIRVMKPRAKQKPTILILKNGINLNPSKPMNGNKVRVKRKLKS